MGANTLMRLQSKVSTDFVLFCSATNEHIDAFTSRYVLNSIHECHSVLQKNLILVPSTSKDIFGVLNEVETCW